MEHSLAGISSMATRPLLADLARAYRDATGIGVAIESVGGVDAARRVAAGEAFDVVFLAADALDALIAGGHVRADSRTDLARSPVAMAVREGDPAPDVSSEGALRAAVLAAKSLGYSTGPSGTALQRLFERWGIADAVRERTVQAPAGVPVAQLVAAGQVALGFQQLSEMRSVPGIRLLGTMPAGTEIVTTFSGGHCARSDRAGAVRALLAWLRSPAAADSKRRHGMDPA